MAGLHPNLLAWALDETFLRDRMCFIAGPRQIGKTTLVRDHLERVGHPERYFNWDVASVRARFRRDPDFFADGLTAGPRPVPVAFDEFHKVPRWKAHLKGLFDAWRGRVRFIVTGSARLDYLRRSKESLVGRYFLYRKLPLGPRECVAGSPPVPEWVADGRPVPMPSEPVPEWREATAQLMALNGFPEPFLAGDERFLNRWRGDHLSLLVTEDLRDLTRIEQVLRVEDLADLLRDRIGSPLSTNSLARDLDAGFPSVRRWLDGLDLVYLTFRIRPHFARLARALRKEPKLYFWDWSLPNDEAARFENFVAVQLQRAAHCWSERGLGRFSVRFVRTRDGHECDFVLLDGNTPLLLVEAKLSDTTPAPSLLKVRRWLAGVPAVQVVATAGVARPHRDEGVAVMSVDRFLQLVP